MRPRSPRRFHQGIDDDNLDFTLYATKMFTFAPRPVILTVGGRATESAHLGLVGFTHHYEFVVEGAVCVLLTDWLAFAREYRLKPSSHKEVPGLIEEEDDWWVLALAAYPSDRCSVAAGYGHFGDLANHPANASLGIAFKYEF